MSDPSLELQSKLRDLSIGEKGPVQDIRRPNTQNPPPRKGKQKDEKVPDSWEDSSSDNEDAQPRQGTVLSPTLSAEGPLDPQLKKGEQAKGKKVPESWEDETSGSENEDAQSRQDAVLSPTLSAEGPLDPPPTPISPQTSNPWTRQPTASAGRTGPERRPAKQTAVAGRLIAGALGIRAPKRTEEQRAYDRSVKEQEIKRRNREREEQAKAKAEEERLIASVWDS